MSKAVERTNIYAKELSHEDQGNNLMGDISGRFINYY